MDELLYQLWLSSLDGISNVKMRKLHDIFGNFETIYNLSGIDFANIDKISYDEKNAIANKSLDKARNILSECDELGINIISYYDESYPERLREIQDAPMTLYVKGKLPPLNTALSISIVGARRSSLYGNTIATKIAYDLAKHGAIIISGMARGIDSAAHRGALKAEADTVAVLGCGVDVVYPPENVELKKMIEGSGAVISEFPPGTPPLANNFPARNRIISGLSVATVIVEGKVTSGSTITARLALDQGREVFCVPGNIDNPLSASPNQLIRDGGRLITGANDIILDLTNDYPELMVETIFCDTAQQKIADRQYEKLPDEQKRILEKLTSNHPKHIDEICYATEIEISIANQCLFMLELNGYVKQLPGKQYILC